jgi:hypothetical protein
MVVKTALTTRTVSTVTVPAPSGVLTTSGVSATPSPSIPAAASNDEEYFGWDD